MYMGPTVNMPPKHGTSRVKCLAQGHKEAAKLK